jgi:hypothetical protein
MKRGAVGIVLSAACWAVVASAQSGTETLVGLDEGDAFLIEDYGATVVWLKDLARVK